MQEWPDDKLDAFFRKLSEEQDPAFEPRNWEKLRNRLDQADGKERFWWRKLSRKGWLLAAGAILSLGILLYLTVFREKESLLPQHQVSVGAEKILTDTLKQGLDPKDKPAIRAPRDEEIRKSFAPTTLPAGTARVTPAEKTLLSVQPAPGSLKKWSRQDNKAGGEPVKPAVRGTNRADGTYFLPGIGQPGIKIQVDSLLAGGTDGTESPDAKASSPISARPLALLDPLSPRPFLPVEPALEIKPVETGYKTETPVALKNRHRWAVRLAAGPDFSAVKMPDFAAPVPAVAAHIDYRVLNHFWIQTGYVRSNKKYSALNGQYTWPAYWSQPVRPESVDATCNMVEIPLNLKYMWGKKPNTAWYVTAGITNYQMRREKYEYNYERPDPQIRRYRWEGSTGWYWLSHTQVSLGYERKLTNHLRIGVEPFVKIPTQKVGFGKVSLYTGGVWLYVSYGR